MSSKAKASCCGPQAAAGGQKADIMSCSSGHLGPHSLNRRQLQRGTKQPLWTVSQSQEGTLNPETVQQRTKALSCVKKKGIKASPTATVLARSEISKPSQDQTTAAPSASGSPRIDHYASKTSAQESKSEHDGKDSNERLKVGHQFCRQLESSLWEGKCMSGVKVAEVHERKLQKELNKLSVHNWPSRDRLAVFSDVFDDVCEGSPIFGRILREIKTEYDLYVNHMMVSQSSALQDMSLNIPSEVVGTGKVMAEELEDAQKEVCDLEQEARKALDENQRVQNELQNMTADSVDIDSDLSELKDSVITPGCTNSIQSKRRQVWNMWKKNQQLETEIKELMASTVATAALETRIKDLKTDIMRLIASNHCLKISNKDLEHKITMVLNKEKTNKTIRRMLWDEILGGMQTSTSEPEELFREMNH